MNIIKRLYYRINPVNRYEYIFNLIINHNRNEVKEIEDKSLLDMNNLINNWVSTQITIYVSY
jgi:hypothetical protein